MPSVRLIIKQARNVMSKDKGIDPYCKYKFMDGKFEGKTATCKNTKNPSWNHIVEFKDVQQTHWQVNIKLMDEDVGSDDKLGEVNIPIDNLPPFKRVTKWFDMNGKGEVEIELSWLPDLCVEAIEARQLKGSSEMDPYLKIELTDMKEPKKTKHKTDTKNPIWREEFKVECRDRDTGNIKYTVMDKETFGDDKEIGSIIVPCTDVPLYDKIEKWYPLNNGGDVHVEMYWIPRVERKEEANASDPAVIEEQKRQAAAAAEVEKARQAQAAAEAQAAEQERIRQQQAQQQAAEQEMIRQQQMQQQAAAQAQYQAQQQAAAQAQYQAQQQAAYQAQQQAAYQAQQQAAYQAQQQAAAQAQYQAQMNAAAQAQAMEQERQRQIYIAQEQERQRAMEADRQRALAAAMAAQQPAQPAVGMGVDIVGAWYYGEDVTAKLRAMLYEGGVFKPQRIDFNNIFGRKPLPQLHVCYNALGHKGYMRTFKNGDNIMLPWKGDDVNFPKGHTRGTFTLWNARLNEDDVTAKVLPFIEGTGLLIVAADKFNNVSIKPLQMLGPNPPHLTICYETPTGVHAVGGISGVNTVICK